MKYYIKDSLSNFQFWSGGKDRADLLTSEQLDTVEQMMEEIEPEEGWSDTVINDFFWFDFDTICEWLGYTDEEHLKKGVLTKELEEANEWAEDTSTDYNSLFAIAGLKVENYKFIDDDGETDYDWEKSTEDFMEWWDGLDDFDKVDEYRKYQY